MECSLYFCRFCCGTTNTNYSVRYRISLYLPLGHPSSLLYNDSYFALSVGTAVSVSDPCLSDKQFLPKGASKNLRQRAAGAKQYDQIVDSLIPRTSKEKQWFALTALAAGICEETVFRGFLFYLLIKVFPLSSISSVILVGLLFGTAYFYQGIKGIFKTALLGILFGFLFLVTNSLFPCILLHILFDLSSAFLYETVEK